MDTIVAKFISLDNTVVHRLGLEGPLTPWAPWPGSVRPVQKPVPGSIYRITLKLAVWSLSSMTVTSFLCANKFTHIRMCVAKVKKVSGQFFHFLTEPNIS